MRPKDPHRNYRSQRLGNDQSNSGQRRLQLSVECSRAFGKKQGAVAGVDHTNEGFQRAAIDPFLLNGDDIEFGEQPPENGRIEKTFFRQKVNRAIAGGSAKWRVEIALMIHRQDDRTALYHPFAMKNAEPEEQAAEQPRKIIAEPVIEVHRAQKDLRCFDEILDR